MLSLENTTKETLKNYTNQTTHNILPIAPQITSITNQNQLNLVWNKINKALIKAATKHIPFKNIKTISEINNNPSSKLPPLFYQYKQIQYLKNHFNSINYYLLLQKYLSDYPNNSLHTTTPSFD